MREIRIRDTLTNELRTLEPGHEGSVGIYACGPTTYGPIHIGNARAFVIPMLLRRFLAHEGCRPKLVINLTDVNDKIYLAAAERGVPSGEHAEEMIRGYVADTDALGVGRPDHEPRATETIGPIVDLIEALIERGHAYESGGDVYFRVRSFEGYGRLSNRDPDAMDQGEEAGAAELKEAPLDFALWKARKPAEDTFWASPWGDGRPGWHIECSAMAETLLGPAFEIHGGGRDIVFPHHENELAQSRARGHEFARIWMHNGMLRFTGEKMSKSVGNVETIQAAVDKWGKDTLLLFFMTAHWRKPIDYSDATLLSASSQWAGLQGAYRVPRVEPPAGEWMRLEKVLDDDFNTPDALRVLHGWRGRGYWSLVDRGLNLFGLNLPDMAGTGIEIDRLLRERDDARADKRWADADRIRDEINRRGHDVIDDAEGSRAVPR